MAWGERLWTRAGAGAPAPRDPIELDVAVERGPPPADPLPERALRWTVEEARFGASLEAALEVSIDVRPPRIAVRLADGFLAAFPSLAPRYALEVPVAVLLARRAFTVVHAAGIVGRAGVVVVRGAPGAGKSTLTAACWRAGLGVLADESLLVSRDEPDDLAAAVRDLTLLPDAAALLGVATEPAYTGGEEKRRIDLLASSRPEDRRGRRVATVVLGPRAPGPARLVPLGRDAFTAAFADGEIPEERRLGDPAALARRWAEGTVLSLEGHGDLDEAVMLVTHLAGGVPPRP